MNTRIVALFFCLLLVGCGADVEQVQFIDVADPTLAAKLGISDQDWLDIKLLAAQRKEFVIKDVGRVVPVVIEVEFKKPDDTRNDQGGPVSRFEKKEGRWIAQSNFDGWWAVGKGGP